MKRNYKKELEQLEAQRYHRWSGFLCILFLFLLIVGIYCLSVYSTAYFDKNAGTIITKCYDSQGSEIINQTCLKKELSNDSILYEISILLLSTLFLAIFLKLFINSLMNWVDS